MTNRKKHENSRTFENVPCLVFFVVAVILTFLLSLSAQATELAIFPGRVQLVGPDAIQTLLITAVNDGDETPASRIDVTRGASFSSSDESVARVQPDGLVVPVGNGRAHITAQVADATVQVEVIVSDHDAVSRINFANDITPILTRKGCNGGECHGKTGGQNGFQLSLLGFDPKADHDAIAHQALGRRVVLSEPEQSLVLLKPSAQIDHEGGKRFAIGSREYRTIHRWIEQGMPSSHADDARLVRVEVRPEQRILSSGGEQQLVVSAFYSDDTRRDVTAHAQYLSSDENSVRVDARGLISVPDGMRRAAGAAVMARYRGEIAISRVSVPRPGPLTNGPTLEARNSIDRLVFANLRKLGISPSKLCDDYTFIRRASLDIIGTLPTPDEIRTFVASEDSDKRQRLVETLLERPEYDDYWTLLWSDLLQNTRAKLNGRGVYAFHRWIHDSVSRNKPLDQFVRELLTARGSTYENGAANYLRMFRDPTEASVAVSQAFLGIRLNCARCHHHPFDRWGQDDFYGFAAHFARIKRKTLSEFEEVLLTASTGEVNHPLTEEPVAPRFLGASQEPDSDRPRRETLAAWLTAPVNPYFARSLANRIWKHFLGTGVVEPVDDLRETNPPSNPQLLDELTHALVSCGFDTRQFIRIITDSYTYQLSSNTNSSNREDRRDFSHATVKRMPAEVLFDAIAQATGVPQKLPGVPLGTRAVQLPDNRTPSYFLDLFGRPKRESPCDCERVDTPSISQVLHLMNSPEIQSQIENPKGRAALLAASSRSGREAVEELYLACHGRPPRPSELEHALGELEGNSERQVVLEDILWALMNAPEFVFNR